MTKHTPISSSNSFLETLFKNIENGEFTEEEMALMLKVLDQVEKQGYFEPDSDDPTFQQLLKKLNAKSSDA